MFVRGQLGKRTRAKLQQIKAAQCRALFAAEKMPAVNVSMLGG